MRRLLNSIVEQPTFGVNDSLLNTVYFITISRTRFTAVSLVKGIKIVNQGHLHIE